MLKQVGLGLVLAAGMLLAGPGPDANAAVVVDKGAVADHSGVTDVRYRGGGGYRGGYRGGFYARPYVYVGPPVAYYGYSYYSGGGHCAWLYRRARETGSRYWWNRYRHEC